MGKWGNETGKRRENKYAGKNVGGKEGDSPNRMSSKKMRGDLVAENDTINAEIMQKCGKMQ